MGTERSWDSHAQYRAAVSPGAGPAPAQLYCAPRRLLAPRAAASLVLAGAGAAAAVCVWVAGGRTVRLPLAGRLRALLLAALTSALLHATLALLAATRLQAQLALDWPRVWLVAALWTAVSLTCGGSLTLHAIVAAPEYRYAPKYIADLLYAAAVSLLNSPTPCAVLRDCTEQFNTILNATLCSKMGNRNYIVMSMGSRPHSALDMLCVLLNI